ncbi:MAG: DMT family transporter [Acidobacteria bacterium]|nr:DMT family transporter [Acidobacteriota bacterium]
MSDYPPVELGTAAAGRRPLARWKADLALLGITLIWGATFVIVKRALADVSTLLFLALRFMLAGAALAMAARGLRVSGRLVAASLQVGAALFAGYVLQTAGLRFTTPSKSAFITGFSVVLVPLFAAAALRRFVGWGPVAGVAAAMGGLYLLTLPAGASGVNRGDLLTLGCAAAFALHILLIGRHSGRVPASGLAAGQVLVAAALSGASLPWGPVFLRPSSTLILAIVITALLATALAFLVQTWAQQYTTPTHTALIFTMEPVFALLTSWLVMGETFSGRAWGGAALILVGILIAELSPRLSMKPPASGQHPLK